MPDAATEARPSRSTPAKGGRPRIYASQSEVDDLKGRLAMIEVRPVGVAAPVSAPDDRAFVENAMTSLIAAGVFTGGDSDLAPMSAVVTALVVTRDLILANIGIEKERRIATLKANGYLGWAGISPE